MPSREQQKAPGGPAKLEPEKRGGPQLEGSPDDLMGAVTKVLGTRHAPPSRRAVDPRSIAALQRSAGNRATGNYLARRRGVARSAPPVPAEQRAGIEQAPVEARRSPAAVAAVGAATTLHRDPTTLQRDPTTLQRDPTTLQRDPTTLQRDPTGLDEDEGLGGLFDEPELGGEEAEEEGEEGEEDLDLGGMLGEEEEGGEEEGGEPGGDLGVLDNRALSDRLGQLIRTGNRTGPEVTAIIAELGRRRGAPRRGPTPTPSYIRANRRAARRVERIHRARRRHNEPGWAFGGRTAEPDFVRANRHNAMRTAQIRRARSPKVMEARERGEVRARRSAGLREQRNSIYPKARRLRHHARRGPQRRN